MPNIGLKKSYAYAPNQFVVEGFPAELIFKGSQLHYIDNWGNHHIAKKKELDQTK